MREIKFRVWNPGGSNMLYDIDNVFECLKQQIKFDNSMPDRGFIAAYDHKGDGMEWMQFTGLKDKKEKEIYDGDILEIRTESGRIERFKVEWGIHRREMKSGYTVDIPSFAFVSDDGTATFPIVNNYVNGHDLNIIEIIGNIHENPELWIP